MRPQETRRYPDEAFYFDEANSGELVIDPAALPEVYPQVEWLKGRDIIATVTNEEGHVYGKYHTLSWQQSFWPGERVVHLESGSSYIIDEWTDDNVHHRAYHFAHAPEATHDITDTNILILEAGHSARNYEDGVILHPANLPLPGRSGDAWELHGVITEDDKLVTWSFDARWLTELALATTVARTAVDCVLLDREIGMERSLRGSLDCNEAAKVYLEHFKQKYGVDYLDITEPKDLFRHLGKPILTGAQFDRYYRPLSR